MILNTTDAMFSAKAKKTQGLRAKHMSTLITDPLALNALLVQTLEGIGAVTADTMYCLGNLGDVWLQDSAKVLKKYDLVKIDAQGWLHFMPKPENEVEFFEVTADMLGADGGYLIGLWGDTVDGVANCQKVAVGDFVARQVYDHNDQWVVKRKIWLNSYTKLV